MRTATVSRLVSLKQTITLHTQTRQPSLENSRFSGNPPTPCVPCGSAFSTPVLSSLFIPQFLAKVSYASLCLLRFLYSADWTSHQQDSECKSWIRVKVFSLVHILSICLVFSARWTDDVFADCTLFSIYNGGQETRNICFGLCPNIPPTRY